MQIKPFFINSNICLKKDDVSSFERFMTSIAGNTGNSYITYALIKEMFGGLVDIRHIQNIYEYNFDNSDSDIEYINNEATHVFLILQDQIRIEESYGLKLPYKKIMNFVSRLNKPVIIAGLGANSFNGFDSEFHKKLDPDLINFLKFLSDHCIEIGIRGHYTEEILHKIGVDNTRVIGCPSFYEMGRNRFVEKKEINDLKSVLLTHRLPLHLPNLYKIMQDFQDENIIKAIAFNLIESNICTENLQELCKQKYRIFSNIEEWKKFVSNFNFALGYRLHGAILAINSGVPALCMNGDSRATEMCQFLGIPHNSNINIQNEEDIFRVYEELDFSNLNSLYSSRYDNFADFLHKNNLLLFEENKFEIIKSDYITQPTLSLYKNEFYISVNNKIYQNEASKIIYELHDKINKYANSLFNDNYKFNENLNLLLSSNRQLNEQINLLTEDNKRLNEKLNLLINKTDYQTVLLNKPTFIQQIFSIKNEGNHKVWRILGFKLKLRRRIK